jgi:hypothetical protein
VAETRRRLPCLRLQEAIHRPERTVLERISPETRPPPPARRQISRLFQILIGFKCRPVAQLPLSEVAALQSHSRKWKCRKSEGRDLRHVATPDAKEGNKPQTWKTSLRYSCDHRSWLGAKGHQTRRHGLRACEEMKTGCSRRKGEAFPHSGAAQPLKSQRPTSALLFQGRLPSRQAHEGEIVRADRGAEQSGMISIVRLVPVKYTEREKTLTCGSTDEILSIRGAGGLALPESRSPRAVAGQKGAQG